MSNNNHAISALPPDFPQAACKADDDRASLFDPQADGEFRSLADMRHREAITLCHLCPHQAQCRIWAINNHHDPYHVIGPVLGGMTTLQRRKYRQRHDLSNPRRMTILDLYELIRPAARPDAVVCDHPRDLDISGYLLRCRVCDQAGQRRRRAQRVEERRTA
jgi:hypothetical protein